MIKPTYESRLKELGCSENSECQPPSASDILTAIKSADAATKQQLKDELAKCPCQETRDIFGDDPAQS